MKFASTAPITGATVYRTKCPSFETIFGPNDLAGFMLAPVNSPKKKARIPTIAPTPIASVNRLDFLLTKTRIEYMRSRVIEISIPQEGPVDTERKVEPETTIIAASQPPIHWAIIYPGNAFLSRSPFAANAIETAGLIWAPEIG